MGHGHVLLAILVIVGLNLNPSTGDSVATAEDFRVRAAAWADKEFRRDGDPTPALFRQLTSAAKTTSHSTSGSGGVEDWIAQCHNLSNDLEQSWNLTIVVVESNWPVVKSVAEILYNTILTCDENGVSNLWNNAKCLIHSLDDLKTVLLPAVKMNLGYVQDAWRLIPPFVNATKECFTL